MTGSIESDYELVPDQNAPATGENQPIYGAKRRGRDKKRYDPADGTQVEIPHALWNNAPSGTTWRIITGLHAVRLGRGKWVQTKIFSHPISALLIALLFAKRRNVFDFVESHLNKAIVA